MKILAFSDLHLARARAAEFFVQTYSLQFASRPLGYHIHKYNSCRHLKGSKFLERVVAQFFF